VMGGGKDTNKTRLVEKGGNLLVGKRGKERGGGKD